jgi:predicted dehydrogenase
MAAICQRTQSKLDEVGDKYSIEKRYTSYEDLLADPDIHAVHINSPIPDHGRQIVELVKQTGLKYMMMETVVYAREFLFMKEIYDNGELGKVQFLKASHQQDMEGWPGLPPMFYPTHCVGPILGLTRGEAEYASCFGSGTIAEEMHACYGSTFAVESCTSNSRTAIYQPNSIARFSTLPASIANRSKFTAQRNPSSGHSSSTIRSWSTPPNLPSPRFRKK